MSIRLLGPVSLTDAGGRELLPAGARVRGLLARLALDAGHPVDTATLVDALWGDDPPSTANALQSLATRLRRAIGADRVRSATGGYLLAVDPDEVDALRFAALRRTAAADPDDDRARALLTEALDLWHGAPLGGLNGLAFAAPAATRLTDARAGAAEELAARGLAAGVPTAGLDALTAVLAEQPLRETTAVALARGLHAAGRRADALAVLDRTRAALAEELGVDPGPELLRTRTELLRDDPPAATAVPARRPGPPQERTRPVALTSFVGREKDLDRVRALLGSTRLVTVVGPGGAGKTRLSQEAVRDVGTAVAVVELAALTGGDQVVPAALHAVGGPELSVADRGGPDAGTRLVSALTGRELVLLLDNCEHLVDDVADLVHDLLARLPGLRVLATSREPLGVPGEVLHPLGSLDPAQATRLFAERAVAVRPDLDPAAHARAVAEICRRLDGQPLPIELAAARVRSMTPAEIADRLADRFRLLVTGARTALPRHQTLRAVVDWSWDLLSPAERAFATRFGVFAGPVDARTVEAVCGDDAFDLLPALVEKSLVVPVDGAEDGATRYRMLETIREYAAARLADAPDHDAVTAAHADHLLAVLEPGEPRLRTGDQLDQLAVVRRVEGEAVRALDRAVDAGDGPRAHRLFAALGWSWMVRGDLGSLKRWSDRTATVPAEAPAAAVAFARTIRATVHIGFGDEPGAAQAELDAVVALWPELPEPRHPVVELARPTGLLFGDGDRSALVAIADGDGEPWLRATASQIIAAYAENTGDLDVQRVRLRAAHELFARTGDRFGLGMTTFALGELEDYAGDTDAARRAWTEAVALSAELGNADDVPQFHLQLARLASRDGDETEAREHLRLAVDHDIVDDPRADFGLRWGRADVELRLGRPQEALDLLQECDAPARPGPGRLQREASTHALIAAALLALGRPGDARERLEQAGRSAVASEDGPILGLVAETSARWALDAGDAERAGELLGVALARRGALHLGLPEVVATLEGVRARLGPAAAEAAVDRGRALPRDAPPTP
ncbi:winged helix-turn-helix domain-containing protein [Pseudonocardia sp. DR1-2]|uniref:BTAD domain-containing putative transcriptional regulator n=1 Tax=Pseudonocardia sp. DR1-2 TaxID=2951168 RepID=UPI00204385AF|nr:BTAD domain-containing putative transcriptional regulator [Pseudonocardia sp. DR1-2]MCM3849739.1 winged helix-turn-helix domain-containing protein [Pseudonocardia sp. DR1-2]